MMIPITNNNINIFFLYLNINIISNLSVLLNFINSNKVNLVNSINLDIPNPKYLVPILLI